MNDGWYEVVDASVQLTQGDFIFGCPITTWANERMEAPNDAEPSQAAAEQEVILKTRRDIIAEDVVVMTQACDLAHGKVSDVVLCPHYGAYLDCSSISCLWGGIMKCGDCVEIGGLAGTDVEIRPLEYREACPNAPTISPKDLLVTIEAEPKQKTWRDLPSLLGHIS
jgi:hypothetical protein